MENYINYPLKQALSFLSRSLCIFGLICAVFSVLRLLFCVSKTFFMMFRGTSHSNSDCNFFFRGGGGGGGGGEGSE